MTEPTHAPTPEPMIELAGARRDFKRRFRPSIVAVDDLDLAIQPGELFGLVGPDGAGKTTILRLLAGVLAPSAGRVTVNGHDVRSDAEAIKPDIGYMPQQFGLYPDLTVDENIDFVCDVFSITGAERPLRVRELLAFTGLEPFRQRRAGRLSGGMQKKLALAAALVHRPRLLLLDEPTTGVDPVARREFWDILTDLHRQGSTVVVSTPYMDEAERCNRVGLMYEGQLMICDTPTAIKQRLPGSVFAVRAADLARASDALRRFPGVIDVQPYGDRLNVIVPDDTTTAGLRDYLTGAGVAFDALHPAPPRLEETFIYFVRQYQARQSPARPAPTDTPASVKEVAR